MFFRRGLYGLTVLAVAGVVSPAFASFHLMQIEQVIGGVNGDTTAQAVQLRMRSGFQNQVQQGRLVVRDAAGANPITLITFPSTVPGTAAGARVLVASANFANYTSPAVAPDFTMTNLIPASYLAAGSLTFEQTSTGSVIWRLSWGGAGYTGSHTGTTFNDADGNFGPAFADPLPSGGLAALRFPGTAAAPSTNNAADYAVTAGAAVFVNNGGASFTVTGPAVDCNGNGIFDGQDIVNGVSEDCQPNGVPDECDIASGASADGNSNSIPDECEVGCITPQLLEARSLASHQTGPKSSEQFYLNLNINSHPGRGTSEPRDSGLNYFEFIFDRPIISGSISIDGGSAMNMFLLDDGSRGQVVLGSALANQAVYDIEVSATTGPGCDLTHSICVSALAGDFNSDGIVNAGDKAEMLGFIFQTINQTNAKYDLQVNGGNSGVIEVGDLGALAGFIFTNVTGMDCAAP